MFTESIGSEKLFNLAKPILGTDRKVSLERAEKVVMKQNSQPNSVKL